MFKKSAINFFVIVISPILVYYYTTTRCLTALLLHHVEVVKHGGEKVDMFGLRLEIFCVHP